MQGKVEETKEAETEQVDATEQARMSRLQLSYK